MEFALQAVVMAAVGLVAGILNVLAGGGSLLTLPMLIFLGLPPAVANGTNRVALVMQNISAVSGFRKQGVFPKELIWLCTPSALVGAFVGAQLAIDIDGELFKKILAGIMIGVLVLMALDPAKRIRVEGVQFTPLRKVALAITFFFVGIYGGFVQAGVGFLFITGLLMHGIDLVRINAVKVFVILLYTLLALGVFAWHGQVNWLLGVILGVGNAGGAWIGSHLAVSKGHGWIRKVVFVTVAAFALKLLLEV